MKFSRTAANGKRTDHTIVDLENRGFSADYGLSATGYLKQSWTDLDEIFKAVRVRCVTWSRTSTAAVVDSAAEPEAEAEVAAAWQMGSEMRRGWVDESSSSSTSVTLALDRAAAASSDELRIRRAAACPSDWSVTFRHHQHHHILLFVNLTFAQLDYNDKKLDFFVNDKTMS